MKLLSLDQRSEAWHTWRDGGLGGSDIGPILLGDDWPYPDSHRDRLFARKLGLEKPAENTFVMRRGTWLEESVRLWYTNDSKRVRPGFQCKPMCVQHDDVDWMRVSLDGLVFAESLGDEEGLGIANIVEIKVPNWQSHTMAIAGVVPEYYRPQVQYQLLVTGLDRLDYVSHSVNDRYKGTRDETVVVPVRPDPELQAEIVEKCEEFWNRLQDAKQARNTKREHNEFAGAY